VIFSEVKRLMNKKLLIRYEMKNLPGKTATVLFLLFSGNNVLSGQTGNSSKNNPG
jgi:hypothetical protein